MIGTIISIIFFVLFIIASFRVYTKADYPWWHAIVPILNIITLCKITGKPGWWFWLFLIPGVNIVVHILVLHGLSVSYNKGVGFTIGLILLQPIFLLILGFSGSCVYRKPVIAQTPADSQE